MSPSPPRWMHSANCCSEAHGLTDESVCPTRGRRFRLPTEASTALIQFLLEAHRTQAQHGDSVYRHGGHLRPQHIHPGAFQEDAAHDLNEVAYGVQRSEEHT